MKIRTSVSGHEIWFWRLEFFSKDLPLLKDHLKRLSFHLGAEVSTWDCESVLRIPDTIHHREQLSTIQFDLNDNLSPITAFRELPELPKYLTEELYTDLPDVNRPIFGYTWPIEVQKFFAKKDPMKDADPEQKTRQKLHSAYRRLAFDFADMGMNNKEMFVLLRNADKRWGLWSDRTERAQKKAIIGLINFVRKKKPETLPNDTDDYLAYGLMSFLAQEIFLEWAIEDLIEKAGLGMVTGDSGTGKTRFLLSMCIHLALGKDFLIWKCPKPMKMMFVSLEMQHAPLKHFVEKMVSECTSEELAMLEENFILFPLGSSIHADKPGPRRKFTQLVETWRPDGVIIDSLGVAVQDDIENQKIVNGVLEYIATEVRKTLGAFVIFVHHHRKHGSNKPSKDDIYGSVYIYNAMTTIITLERVTPEGVNPSVLRVKNPKLRLVEEFKPFNIITNTGTIQYDLVSGGIPKKTLDKLGEAKEAEKAIKFENFD